MVSLRHHATQTVSVCKQAPCRVAPRSTLDGVSTWFERLDQVLARRDDISASELARQIRQDRSNISHYRKGRRRPDPETLTRLCAALGISADWLLGLDEGKAPEVGFSRPRVQAALAKLEEARALLTEPGLDQEPEAERRGRRVAERVRKAKTRQRRASGAGAG